MAVESFQQVDLTPWTSYSPSLRVDAGTALGSGNTITGFYKQIGKTTFVRMSITIGASGIGGATQLAISLPVTSTAAACLVGYNSTTGLGGSCPILGAFTHASLSTAAGGALVTANNHVATISGTYEAA